MPIDRPTQMLGLLAQARSELPGRPVTEAGVATWVMIGLTGLTAMLHRLTTEGLVIGEGWEQALTQCVADLIRVTEAQRAQRSKR